MHNDEKLKLHLIFRKKNCIIIQNKSFAGVMELADVPDSKSGGSDTVPVRPRSPAPNQKNPNQIFPIGKGFGIFVYI